MRFILKFILYHRFKETIAVYEKYQDGNSRKDLHFTGQHYYWYSISIIITAGT